MMRRDRQLILALMAGAILLGTGIAWADASGLRPPWRNGQVWHLEDHPAWVLACPGVDLIRLWPLPPVWPWSEDGGEWPAFIHRG